MNYLKSFMTYAATGGTVGFAMGYSQSYSSAPLTEKVVYGGIGAACGAAFGGALGVSRKIGPVAMSAVLGAGAGALCGVPVCTLLAAMGSDAPGATTFQMCSIFGICSCIPLLGGGMAGAVSTKIEMIFLRFLLKEEIQTKDQKTLTQNPHIDQE